MANRMADSNIIIVDSAMGNLGVFMGTGNITRFDITSIYFRATDTSGRCIISGVTTTNIIADFSVLAHVGSGGLVGMPIQVTFPKPVNVELKVPTISAGTAWISLA